MVDRKYLFSAASYRLLRRILGTWTFALDFFDQSGDLHRGLRGFKRRYRLYGGQRADRNLCSPLHVRQASVSLRFVSVVADCRGMSAFAGVLIANVPHRSHEDSQTITGILLLGIALALGSGRRVKEDDRMQRALNKAGRKTENGRISEKTFSMSGRYTQGCTRPRTAASNGV